VTALDMSALTGPQQDVLGQIAIGFDQGHPPKTLVVLAAKGLISGHQEMVPGFPPVRVTRWTVPVNIHVQWAAWCAAQPDDDLEENQP
jgi:hypothetical protein